MKKRSADFIDNEIIESIVNCYSDSGDAERALSLLRRTSEYAIRQNCENITSEHFLKMRESMW
ncbi:MAG: hypothetical protein H7645_02945 [Candidatus Heimdallarchaeota archaeon]|nr:hypothetical protein [Candidatus Heimdallarchaeota archaeon]MCK4769273.1 hypothetical protein [Candidatus Heimdallarchaeota archaeon]